MGEYDDAGVHDEFQTRILPIHSTKIDSSAILSSAKKTAATPNRREVDVEPSAENPRSIVTSVIKSKS